MPWAFLVPKPKYMTLGQQLYTKRVLPPTCYFSSANPYFLAGSAAFFVLYVVAASNHDLKHFSKSDLLRFAGGVSMDFCPRRATKIHQCLLVYSITTKYMTLGPNFYTKLVLPPNCYFCFVNPYFLAGSAAFFVLYAVAVSKHDLKHFSKSDLLGFAACQHRESLHF